MKKKAVSGTMLTLLLTGMLASITLFSFPLRVNAQFEEWVPYVPDARYVELDYWKENGTSYMDISIEFPSTGYNVSDWGTPTIVGNNVSANAEIWDWTGVDSPVVIKKGHTYSLGNLPAGEYLFTFKAWGFPVKNTTFTVIMRARASVDVYTQREPYSGKGPNQPSDAFAPQEEVILFAYVSYYEEPVANKLVAFQVNDPTGEGWLYRTNSTDENGVATISFRIPTAPAFGEWTVYATVDIAEQTVNDTLTFQVGWIVEIIKVETVDTYGASRTSFTKGEHVYFNVTIRNIAFTSKEATITIVVYDECGVPIGLVTLQDWMIGSGKTEIFIIDLQIPNWAYVGVATIYANAYTDMPHNGGTPYCPEAYATFMITRT